jgi:hypothetical protein
MGEMRFLYNFLVRKPEVKRLFGRPRCRWEDNILMDHREVGREVVAWTCLAQERD